MAEAISRRLEIGVLVVDLLDSFLENEGDDDVPKLAYMLDNMWEEAFLADSGGHSDFGRDNLG